MNKIWRRWTRNSSATLTGILGGFSLRSKCSAQKRLLRKLHKMAMFQNEAKSKAIDINMIFNSHATWKRNSFPQDWFCPLPCLQSKSFWNSEITFFSKTQIPQERNEVNESHKITGNGSWPSTLGSKPPPTGLVTRLNIVCAFHHSSPL